MREVLAYAEFESLWARFAPETPFGRDAKAAAGLITDGAELEAHWDRTERALELLDRLTSDPVRLSRLSHHLKRLPRFQEEARSVYDEVELFQVKKLLHNAQGLLELIDSDLRAAFGLPEPPPALARLLDQGRQSAESFYVADAYSPELAAARAVLQEADAALAAVRTRRAEAIEARWGLDLRGRDFLVVPHARLGELSDTLGLLQVEPYDRARVLVRPLPSGEELALLERRTALLGQERICEDAVLSRLSEAVREALPELLRLKEALTALDLALARARLARELGLTRPHLTSGPLCIQGGRFLPCEALCRDLGTPYLPLDLDLDRGTTVVFGSNMGGKTIALKTVAFLQLCAQHGLFVPATRFETRVFHTLAYIGEGRERERTQGLSGFGFEIRQLVEALEAPGVPALLLFDEFARTTSSHEAEALLGALVEALAERDEVVALFSTHFRGLPRTPQAAYLRMGGLDRAGLDLREGAGEGLDARIRRINTHMRFRLVPDEGRPAASDALAVAALLGLDPRLAARAEALYRTEP